LAKNKNLISGENMSLLALLASYSGASKRLRNRAASALRGKQAKSVGEHLLNAQGSRKKSASRAAARAEQLRDWAADNRKSFVTAKADTRR
jgi:hypothetical protein